MSFPRPLLIWFAQLVSWYDNVRCIESPLRFCADVLARRNGVTADGEPPMIRWSGSSLLTSAHSVVDLVSFSTLSAATMLTLSASRSPLSCVLCSLALTPLWWK